MAQGILMSGQVRRRSWSDAQRRAILEEAFGDGGLPSSVARRYDISTGQLYTWRKKALMDAGLTPAAQPAFLPAVLATPQEAPPSPDEPARSAPAIEIQLKKGVKVRIEAGVPDSVIAATLKALR